jgi:DNA-binding IclR family transcriptional regulator
MGASSAARLDSRASDLGVRPEPIHDLSRRADSSAAKALALIDAFAGPRAVLGITELAARAHMPKSTAHRLIMVLMDRGYVRRVGDRYCLSERIFEMATFVRMCRPGGLRSQATPYIAELFAQTRLTVHLAVLRETEVLYVDKLYGHNAARCDTVIGTRKAAHSTALGKALLAYAPDEVVDRNLRAGMRRFTSYTITRPDQLSRSLDHIRQVGYATDYEENQPGVNCLAAPVIDRQTKTAVAAISICAPSARDLERRFSYLLAKVAAEFGRARSLSAP